MRAGLSSVHGLRSARVGGGYFSHQHPGVYLERQYGLPRATWFWTGTPVFLGVAPKLPSKTGDPKLNVPIFLSLWSHFEWYVGMPSRDEYLAYAVRGFFANGGRRCYVLLLTDHSADSLFEGLRVLESLDSVDLICAPDLFAGKESALVLQQIVIDHCELTGDRFAILDSPPAADTKQVGRQWSEIDGRNGSLYYPWLRVAAFGGVGSQLVPPCGHVAGVYARTDTEYGVHKAPANEALEDVFDLERRLSDADQDELNPRQINCLRSFPGRGIRVWGARTLSGQATWTYVNVRRIFLTAVRWMHWNMQDVVFEPHDSQLWGRIERELTTYFNDQFLAGALKGRTPQEAFYVKCNAETNPPELQDAGQVVTEIGLAATTPFEFVIVRLIQGERGVSISGPTSPQ